MTVRAAEMSTFLIALRALVYMTGLLLVGGWLAMRVRTFDRSFGVVLPAWAKGFGLVLMLGGGMLAFICAAVFTTRGRGTQAVFDPPRKFITAGPYKYVRNPMYLGYISLLLGFGLYQQSAAILLLALCLLLLIHLFICFVEEAGLERRFDGSYLEYKRSVNRWIPRWR
jgi:protein-S-isoprenylcysteine O-methyltransferase Ste14